MSIAPFIRTTLLLLAVVLLAPAVADAQSLACRLKRCDDGNPCTADSCRGFGVCVFEPRRCDDGDACTLDACDVGTGACRFTPIAACGGPVPCTGDACEGPEPPCVGPACVPTPCTAASCDDGNPCTSDACEGGTCRHRPLDGGACPDDGWSCTDEVCGAGVCLHVPIDSRCLPAGECTSAACAPQAPGADVGGCLPGTAIPEGMACAEDGLPCTDDVCRGGGCAHATVADAPTCEPVTKAFRLALALASQARTLGLNVAAVADAGGPAAARGIERLAQLEVALGDAARTLAGRSPLLATARAGGLERTTAQLRAVAAAGRLAGAPRVLREVLIALRTLAGVADPGTVSLAREQARALRRGIRRLKVELRRVQRVQQTFAP